MKMLWFPRLELDIDNLHITTWREMTRELERLGWEVKLAVSGDDSNRIVGREYIRIPLIKIKFIRTLNFWISGFIIFVYQYLMYRPDAVILDIFSIWFSLPFVIFPKCNCRFIVDNRTPHYNIGMNESNLRDKMMRIYTNFTFRYCRLALDGMTVITSHYKDQVCKKFNFKESTIGVWGSGVDLTKFSIRKFKDQKRDSLFRGKFVLFQHGQISSNRGIFETVKALQLIKYDDVILVIVGDVIGKTNEKIELVNFIKAHNLQDKVHFIPPVPFTEVPKYISYSDCAVMAYPNIEYWNNNNPIKLLEYLAMGKVIICTDMWTFRNVAKNKKCVCYIEKNSPELIAEAILYCYKNRNMLAQWGRSGVAIIKEKHTWRAQAINLHNFIVSLEIKEI